MHFQHFRTDWNEEWNGWALVMYCIGVKWSVYSWKFNLNNSATLLWKMMCKHILEMAVEYRSFFFCLLKDSHQFSLMNFTGRRGQTCLRPTSTDEYLQRKDTSDSFDIVPGSSGRLNFFCEPIAAGKGGAENMAATVLIRVIHDCICSAFLWWIIHAHTCIRNTQIHYK